jgi:hypothetical protein
MKYELIVLVRVIAINIVFFYLWKGKMTRKIEM